MRARSDHEEEPVGIDGLVGSVCARTQHEVLQPPVAPTADDLGPETDLQLWRGLHLADQVVRHPRAERLSAYHERDAPCVTSEVQRSLSSRVRAAEDVDVAAGHGRRLRSRTAVEDAGAVQRLERRDAESAVAGAGRQEHRAGSHAAAVGERDEEPVVLAPKVGHPLHEREVRPEDPRLLVCLLSQAPTADPSREAEVVANQRTGGCLAPNPAFVDDQGAESFRGAIHGCRQTGRPGADDHEVEIHPLRVDRRARRPRDLGVAGVCQDRAVGEDDDWQLCPAPPPRRRGRARRSSRPGRTSAGSRSVRVASLSS